MSTDCENLLKKFLVLNPAKRASLETIMKDRWMNIGYEEDEMRPYIEPLKDIFDSKKVECLQQLGYAKSQVMQSLNEERFDDIFATYLLMTEKKLEVRKMLILCELLNRND